MRVEIKEITAAQAERIMEILDAGGMKYDVDYEALHGTGWAITGVILLTPAAAIACPFHIFR